MTTRDEYVLARVDGKCQRRQPGCLIDANYPTELVMRTEFLERMSRNVDYADNWCATCTNCKVGTLEEPGS